MRLCALDTIHHTAFNKTAKCTSLHAPKYALKYTPSLFDLRSQVSSQDTPKYTSEYILKYTPRHALKDAPNGTRWRSPSLLDYTLSRKLSRRSQVHSEYTPKYTSKYVLKYTPGHAFKDAPNCTRWHTPSLLDCTLSSKLSRRSQAHS